MDKTKHLIADALVELSTLFTSAMTGPEVAQSIQRVVTTLNRALIEADTPAPRRIVSIARASENGIVVACSDGTVWYPGWAGDDGTRHWQQETSGPVPGTAAALAIAESSEPRRD